ncbi:MAG: exodeoxyribonuclease VII large subunit, partial [Duncaniella sp.]|nr:exodeoxyribonuclease VII large subunit [Duncaniella sp.]
VIIRGGGATSDLAAFDDYDLAANIAQFPLPVIIGIGHERDVTVLDYVANMRVKTPTAAAEWLISRGEEALESLESLATLIYTYASELLSGSRQQLARIEATLPHLPQAALSRASARLSTLGQTLAESALTRLRPDYSRLDVLAERVKDATVSRLERSALQLDRYAEKMEILSPASTLARGYSITRVDGHALTSASGLRKGTVLVTTLADGTVTSVTL